MRAVRRILAFSAVLAAAACGPEDPTVKVTPISIISDTVGIGEPAKADDLVTIDYRILTDEGREVNSQQGYRFILGTGAVIEGIDDAVKGMKIAGERTIRCPPHRHWGRDGYGDDKVPANATLTIEIKLKAID